MFSFILRKNPGAFRSLCAVFVPATVSGSFPGSPIALTYRFGMENNRIAALEIA